MRRAITTFTCAYFRILPNEMMSAYDLALDIVEEYKEDRAVGIDPANEEQVFRWMVGEGFIWTGLSWIYKFDEAAIAAEERALADRALREWNSGDKIKSHEYFLYVKSLEG